MMTEKEIHDAGDALIDWFKSQGLSPADGACVMVSVEALQLVAYTQDRKELAKAIQNIAMLLAVEINENLRIKERAND